MTEIDLEQFQSKVRVRNLTMADFERVVELQLACFPGMPPWGKEQFESQQTIFPRGSSRSRWTASCWPVRRA